MSSDGFDYNDVYERKVAEDIATIKPVLASFKLNRLHICVIACLGLWLTSLQNAVGIVKSFIATPGLASITANCNGAYTAVNREKSDFERCLSEQLNVRHTYTPLDVDRIIIFSSLCV